MTAALCPSHSGGYARLKTKAFKTAETMLALVLPSGFPGSVRHPYGTYAAWQFTAMTASAAAGVMSTQALVSYKSLSVVVPVLPLLLLSLLQDKHFLEV